MARGWHYTKLSLSSAILLSFPGMCFVFKEKSEIVPSFCRFLFCFCFVLVLCFRGSFVDIPYTTGYG